MSKLKTNTIRHTGGSADNITLDNSQNVTVENNLTVDGTSTLTGNVTASGNVGINEATPVNKLTISNASQQTDSVGNLQIRYTGSNGADNSGLTVKNYKGTSQFMQWSDGGVRIGSRILTNSGAGNIYFTTGSDSVKATLLASNGDLELAAGNLKVASGKGIDFSAAGNASGKTGELFSDYEEGTWTPALTNGPSLSSAHGRYTKIGRMVYATFQLNCGSDGTAAHVYINNLPFTSISGDPNAGSVAWDYRNGMNIITHISQGNARIYFYNNNGGALEGNESQFESKEHRGTAIYTAA